MATSTVSSSPPTSPPGGWSRYTWQTAGPSGSNGRCTTRGPRCARYSRRVVPRAGANRRSTAASQLMSRHIVEERVGAFPDDEHHATLRARNGMDRSGWVDDVRALDVFARIVALGADEDVD